MNELELKVLQKASVLAGLLDSQHLTIETEETAWALRVLQAELRIILEKCEDLL